LDPFSKSRELTLEINWICFSYLQSLFNLSKRWLFSVMEYGGASIFDDFFPGRWIGREGPYS
jgi:hypothetical protein